MKENEVLTYEGYYRALIHLSVPENRTGEERSDVFRLSDYRSTLCAIITVRQDIIPY